MLASITFIPLIGALTIFLVSRDDRRGAEFWGLFFSCVTLFLVLLLIFFGFQGDYGEIKFLTVHDWIPQLGVQFKMGIDGISLWMVFLTAFLTPICIYYSTESIRKNYREFVALLLLLETGLISVFLALDLVLFYFFWVAVLIPMYFLIGVWGGERRIHSALKFFIYTMFGSVLMLIAILVLSRYALNAGISTPFDLESLYAIAHNLPDKTASMLFWFFFIAFAIRVPIFPFHTWLPDAHTDAPTTGSVILAGVLLKMGTYGFLRFCIPLFPQQSYDYALLISILAIIGIIYAAWVATMQPDIKRLIAYSSVSYLGLSVLGIFSFTMEGMTGGLLHMLNHGLSAGALFLIAGIIYARGHTGLIAKYGGLMKTMPTFSVCFLIIMFSSIGLPGLNGFVSMILVLIGSMKSVFHSTFPGVNWAIPVLAVTGVIWSAVYMLWMYQRVMLGAVKHEQNKSFSDVSKRELWCLVPIIVLCILIGIFPKLFTKPMEEPLRKVLDRIHYEKPIVQPAWEVDEMIDELGIQLKREVHDE